MQPHGSDRYNEIYKPMRERAAKLQEEFHDFLGGDFKDPKTHVLHTDMKGLVDDIDSRKPLNGVDHRIKSIQNQLHQSKYAPDPIMDIKHLDYMHKSYEDMHLGIHRIEQQGHF